MTVNVMGGSMIVAQCEAWNVSPVIGAADVGMLCALAKLDVGEPETEVLVRVDGVVGERYRVTLQTANCMFERATQGWRLPPAVHYLWMEGLPMLEHALQTIQRYAR